MFFSLSKSFAELRARRREIVIRFSAATCVAENTLRGVNRIVRYRGQQRRRTQAEKKWRGHFFSTVQNTRPRAFFFYRDVMNRGATEYQCSSRKFSALSGAFSGAFLILSASAPAERSVQLIGGSTESCREGERLSGLSAWAEWNEQAAPMAETVLGGRSFRKAAPVRPCAFAHPVATRPPARIPYRSTHLATYYRRISNKSTTL